MTTRTLPRLTAAAGALLMPLLALAEDTISEGVTQIGHPPPMSEGALVTIVGLGLLFVLGIIAIALIGPQLALRGALRQRMELIDKLLAAGQPVPPELLTNAPPPGAPPPPGAQLPTDEQAVVNRARSLRRGVALLGWGVGLSAVSWFGFDSPHAASWGLLFLALSVASFINARYFSGARKSD